MRGRCCVEGGSIEGDDQRRKGRAGSVAVGPIYTRFYPLIAVEKGLKPSGALQSKYGCNPAQCLVLLIWLLVFSDQVLNRVSNSNAI
jgi:hypothetical protein